MQHTKGRARRALFPRDAVTRVMRYSRIAAPPSDTIGQPARPAASHMSSLMSEAFSFGPKASRAPSISVARTAWSIS